MRRWRRCRIVSPKSGGIFDLDHKIARLQELESIASQSTFWDNQQQAQESLRELTRLKEDIARFTRLETAQRDLTELAHLADNGDAEILKELQTSLQTLETELREMEREAKFSESQAWCQVSKI